MNDKNSKVIGKHKKYQKSRNEIEHVKRMVENKTSHLHTCPQIIKIHQLFSQFLGLIDSGTEDTGCS